MTILSRLESILLKLSTVALKGRHLPFKLMSYFSHNFPWVPAETCWQSWSYNEILLFMLWAPSSPANFAFWLITHLSLQVTQTYESCFFWWSWPEPFPSLSKAQYLLWPMWALHMTILYSFAIFLMVAWYGFLFLGICWYTLGKPFHKSRDRA